jgi:hypothetical protein
MIEFLKILSQLKQIIIWLINSIHKWESSKVGSVVKVLTIGILTPFVIYFLLIKSHIYFRTKANNIIYEQVSYLLKECGNLSFVSWVAVKDSALEVGEKSFVFHDVIGCVGDNVSKCIGSVKLDNPIYSKEYPIGLDDQQSLKEMRNGSLKKYEIINNKIVNNNPKNRPPSILIEIASLTNYPLRDVRYVVVRDHLDRLIYIFVLTFATNSTPTCSSQIANTLLDNLARTARENL